MTFIKPVLFLSLLLFLAACKPSKILTGEVNFQGPSETGTLLLTAAGYGKTKALATQNAELNAFNNLLFRGIPGTQYQLPMIADEAAARKAYPAYFQQFFDERGYRSFMMVSEPGAFVSRKNSPSLISTIKINADALRRDLEARQVIRKFGL